MTLRVEYQVMEPKDPSKVKNSNTHPPAFSQAMSQQQLVNELNHIQNMKNPAQQQQRLIQLLNKLQNQQQKAQVQQIQWVQKQLQQQASNYKTVTYAKEFDLKILPKVHVAKKLLGMEYDDKGNIKEYTPDELKKMKDDQYSDFFKANFKDVTTGLQVYVVLAKPKEPAKETPKDDKDKGDGDKEKAIDDKDKTLPLPDFKADDKKGDDKAKPGDKKPGVDISDIINGKVPDKPTPPPAGTAAAHPDIQAIIILSEPVQQDTAPPPEKKKKKNN